MASGMNFFADKNSPVSLDKVRETLIRLEDTIIFALIERAQFAQNTAIYEKKNSTLTGDFEGSFMEWMLRETEVLHAKARRFTSPDENPFFDNLPEPVLPALNYPNDILFPNTVNVNSDILNCYEEEIIPALCKPGDDLQYGSSACKDVDCLQLLSRRIHYGKFVAEAKFINPKEHDMYVALIKAGDTVKIEELLTNRAVEERLLRRLKKKAMIYGQDIADDDAPPAENGVPGSPSGTGTYKFDLDLVVRLYEKYVIPLTKKVEVDYLMQRLGDGTNY